MVMGLLFVVYINQIAEGLEYSRDRKCSIRRSITSTRFQRAIEPLTVLGVVVGAVLIAVLASVLPALRARGCIQWRPCGMSNKTRCAERMTTQEAR